jgi:hypothetical protein
VEYVSKVRDCGTGPLEVELLILEDVAVEVVELPVDVEVTGTDDVAETLDVDGEVDCEEALDVLPGVEVVC